MVEPIDAERDSDLSVRRDGAYGRPRPRGGAGSRWWRAASEVKRVYLKRVKVYGDYVCWDDGQGLLDHAARSNAYFLSIYEYHGSEEPWATADLVIQRTEEV